MDGTFGTKTETAFFYHKTDRK